MMRDSSGGDIAMAAAPAPPHGGGGGVLVAAEEVGNSNSGEEERSSNRGGDEGDERINGGGGGGGGLSGGNYGGGNRWPRPETIALLRIRSEMDSVFRDSTPKAPLWEEVSRKLAELGYHRSAKKCKEKFENVYKYHKRTKDGRTAKHDGKTYRFFEELEAFEGKSTATAALPPPLKAASAAAAITPALPWAAVAAPNPNNNTIPHQIMATVPSAHGNSTINATPIPAPTPTTTTSINFTITPPSHLGPTAVTRAEPISSSQPLNPSPQSVFHPSYHHRSSQHHNHAAAAAHLFSSSTSSSTASDEELEDAAAAAPASAAGMTGAPAAGTRKRKRKWKDFFHKLTKDVIRKQEELQKKFLETVEKLDRERLVREDAWRVQEMARINREHEVLIQERSTAAAKDAAVLAFLQKMSGGGGGQQQVPSLSLPPPPQPPLQVQPAQAAATVAAPAPPATALALVPAPVRRESGSNEGAASGSRWPKVEVHALIALRTRLDEKYQENGPKGPLWEEISSEMKKIGYNRSSKRCKEKWENINKYFKKVKESNKRRPEDSKTCPYFHQLDALYREKSNSNSNNNKGGILMSSTPTVAGGGVYIAANPLRAVEPAMRTQPEQQQWQQAQTMAPVPSRNGEEEEEGEEGEEYDEEDDYDDLETEDDEDEEGNNRGGFQVVQNRPLESNDQ